jgi:hypothetical protein
LVDKLEELYNKISTNSRNISNPCSTDPKKKDNRNNEKKIGKQHPALNLCNRMLKLQKKFLHFLWDYDVPFTNNEDERDRRMSIVQMKFKDRFRSEDGARCFTLFWIYYQTIKSMEQKFWKGYKSLLILRENIL